MPLGTGIPCICAQHSSALRTIQTELRASAPSCPCVSQLTRLHRRKIRHRRCRQRQHLRIAGEILHFTAKNLNALSTSATDMPKRVASEVLLALRTPRQQRSAALHGHVPRPPHTGGCVWKTRSVNRGTFEQRIELDRYRFGCWRVAQVYGGFTAHFAGELCWRLPHATSSTCERHVHHQQCRSRCNAGRLTRLRGGPHQPACAVPASGAFSPANELVVDRLKLGRLCDGA